MKRLLAAAFGVALIAASCGGGGGSPAASPRDAVRHRRRRGPDRIAVARRHPRRAGASASHAPLGTVRLALDWTPNTNHTGFYVAAANGWYGDAGVDFRVLPYGTTAPEALVGAGQAECGISFQDSMTFAVAAGAPIVSVMAILQHTAQEIAVLDTSTIARPRDLDGRTYAGFGYPNEEPTLKAVIKADGGKGTFKTVTLDTAAYDALYAKRADFVIMFTAWEGVEAKERGIAHPDVRLRRLRVPRLLPGRAGLQPGMAGGQAGARPRVPGGDRPWLPARGDRSGCGRRACSSPRTRASSTATRSCPSDSQRFLASTGLLTDESGQVGRQTLAKWQGYSGFLFEQGLLTGADGKPLTTAPDYGSLFTNDYLP